MQVHGSCAARNGWGVLLVGPPGSGKSDLLLRLIDRGFMLVADDRVDILAGHASAPPALAGLLEVRGLGLMRLPSAGATPLALVVDLEGPVPRLPEPARHAATGLPLIALDARAPSAAQVVELALACALGQAGQTAGAFAP